MTGFEIAAFIGKNRNRSAVIPAQAGIQTLEQQQYSKVGGFAFEVQLSLTEKGQYAVAY
ncbi:TPA: hypothetical protein WI763_001692, partial [Neisseria meningitidis]